MSERQPHAFCHAPTRGPDQMPHRCNRDQGHEGEHRCTCNYEWADAVEAKPSSRSPKPGK